jgi:hypothetical protein
MPNYTFKNETTNEVVNITMSISERDAFVLENPNMKQMITSAPTIGDTIRMGMTKPDNGFRDVLREIKKKHSQGITKSTVNTFD